MGMTPEQFFESFVVGNLEDCIDQPGDIRRAFNASVSASHLADHYFLHSQRHQPDLVAPFSDIGKFVEHLSTETAGAFRDVRSISNVYKHLYTDKGNLAQYSSVNSCGSIDAITLKNDEELQGPEEDYVEGNNGEALRRVIVTLKDGSRKEVLAALESVTEYFRALLYAKT
ncbi:hypothetical protein [Stenotrophobium rhamnosiphilum]|uniref:Uncharacterized protein n=1 Tax=Stenotrophobium rhamnosiphilum TaxID=2029166 RepID=A0A2T5MHR8_9GAMM|nr:hypothetical protein [Stenotrophobium rhamnosiphilum]PTU32126.1 hypothetical protein CJD38_05515 [Stenotrophobium rhamnosiphilum]